MASRSRKSRSELWELLYRVIRFERETKTATTSNGVIMVTKMIKVGPTFLLKIRKFILRMVEVVWRELKICCRR